ncbi:MAG: hypothetical protein AAFY17_14380, partial [Cyanobacteria bacterium J06642_11]
SVLHQSLLILSIGNHQALMQNTHVSVSKHCIEAAYMHYSYSLTHSSPISITLANPAQGDRDGNLILSKD